MKNDKTIEEIIEKAPMPQVSYDGVEDYVKTHAQEERIRETTDSISTSAYKIIELTSGLSKALTKQERLEYIRRLEFQLSQIKTEVKTSKQITKSKIKV